MGEPAPPRWPQPDGSPVSCREKIKVLEENWAEVSEVVRDAFEDAVLMGVDAEAMRRRLADLVASLAAPGRTRV
ncbi:MAG: hypothetical protein SNJ73_07965 [Acetobacteraceae bacterium]